VDHPETGEPQLAAVLRLPLDRLRGLAEAMSDETNDGRPTDGVRNLCRMSHAAYSMLCRLSRSAARVDTGRQAA
jgi:hypothetical protein